MHSLSLNASASCQGLIPDSSMEAKGATAGREVERWRATGAGMIRYVDLTAPGRPASKKLMGFSPMQPALSATAVTSRELME